MKTNLEHYKEWEKSAESKFKILGDLAWINSLNFEITEEDFFQIGLDPEDEETFCFNIYKNEELEDYRTSTNYKDLYKWLEEINNTIV